MTRRRVLLLAAITALLSLTVLCTATAYEGTSTYDNLAPESEVHGKSERYPSSRYGLDSYVGPSVKTADTGPGPFDGPDVPTGLNTSNMLAGALHSLASLLWDITRFVSAFVITIFTFAFSLDLIGGATGVLKPVIEMVRDLYNEVGVEWFATAVALVGLWAAWKTARRDVAGTVGGLLMSLALVAVSLLLITQPEWTIGGASRYSNDVSNAFLGAVNGDDYTNAKTAAADAMHDTLIHKNWVALNFGGLEHCVDKNDKPVKPRSRECRNGGTHINNDKKYADRWLRAGPPGDVKRLLEHEALRLGRTPEGWKMDVAGVPESAFANYPLSAADKPAIDIQGADIAGERAGLAFVILIGSMGAWLLIGGLSVGVILAQLIFLLGIAFAPIMMIVGIFPGGGHAAFLKWGGRLVYELARKIVYSVILAVVLMMSRALTSASANLGWLLAFGLSALFFWMVFLYRKELADQAFATMSRISGGAGGRTLGQRAQGAYYTARMGAPLAAGALGVAKGGWKGSRATNRLATEGAHIAVDKTRSQATKGHTKRIAQTAHMSATAIGQLQAEHTHRTQAVKGETDDRERRSTLLSRQRIADDGVAEVALTVKEQRELEGLQRKGRMPESEFQGLKGEVRAAEKRERESGVAFSEAQVAQRVREIAEREQSAKQAAARSRTRHGDGTPPNADDSTLAERTRRYTKDGYGQIFDSDETPTSKGK